MVINDTECPYCDQVPCKQRKLKLFLNLETFSQTYYCILSTVYFTPIDIEEICVVPVVTSHKDYAINVSQPFSVISLQLKMMN